MQFKSLQMFDQIVKYYLTYATSELFSSQVFRKVFLNFLDSKSQSYKRNSQFVLNLLTVCYLNLDLTSVLLPLKLR